MKKIRKLSRQNEDIVFKWKDSFIDSMEKDGPEQIQFMFETTKMQHSDNYIKNFA